jgi:hypothetical protein
MDIPNNQSILPLKKKATFEFYNDKMQSWSIHLLFGCTGTSGNFNKINENVATTQRIPYDLRSIMHYDAYAFSTNGRPTIEPRNTRVKLSNIGQRQGFTDLDLQHVNTLYGCNNQPSGLYNVIQYLLHYNLI